MMRHLFNFITFNILGGLRKIIFFNKSYLFHTHFLRHNNYAAISLHCCSQCKTNTCIECTYIVQITTLTFTFSFLFLFGFTNDWHWWLTIVILKNGSRTAVQQLQNFCTNKRQTKLKHLRLCILNLSATYKQPRANWVVIPKISFTDVCTSGFAIHNFLCWSHSGRRSRSAHRCGLSIVFIWAKSSVSRTYKNYHMLPTRSWLLFYFFDISDGDKMGSSKWNRLHLHMGQSVTLITSFSFGNITTHTRSISEVFFSDFPTSTKIYCSLRHISARYVYCWVRCF